MSAVLPQLIRRKRVGTPLFVPTEDNPTADPSIMLNRGPQFLAPIVRTPEPIVSEPIAPMGNIVPRETQPLINIPAPASVRYNDKGRPIGAEGGFDQLSRDRALLEAQQSYKPKASTKNLLLSLGLGFLSGGLPGVAAQGLGYALDPAAMDRMQNQREIERTQESLQGGLARQKFDENLLNDQTDRAYKDMLIKRTPNLQTQEAVDESGNTIQMEYDPQTKSYRPSKTASGGPLITRRPTPAKPQPEMVEVNVGGQTLKVRPGEALGYYGAIGKQDQSITREVGEAKTKLDAANTRVAAAKTAAEAYQQQLAALDQQAGSIVSNAPLTVVNKETGIPEVVRNADGSVVYDQKSKTPERAKYERDREDLQKKLNDAKEEFNKATIEAQQVYVPPQPIERADPRVKEYAEKYFGGDVSKAQAAIKSQRGQ